MTKQKCATCRFFRVRDWLHINTDTGKEQKRKVSGCNIRGVLVGPDDDACRFHEPRLGVNLNAS